MNSTVNVPFRYEGGNQNFYKPEVRQNMEASSFRGVVLQHPFPNRRQRRTDLQRIATNNRKEKPGVRYKQRVEVTTRTESKWGPLVAGTGFFRTVMHKLIPAKVFRFITANVWGAQERNISL